MGLSEDLAREREGILTGKKNDWIQTLKGVIDANRKNIPREPIRRAISDIQKPGSRIGVLYCETCNLNRLHYSLSDEGAESSLKEPPYHCAYCATSRHSEPKEIL